MLILGIDTSGPAVAAALLEGERVVAARARRAGRRGAPALGAVLDELWSGSGTGPSGGSPTPAPEFYSGEAPQVNLNDMMWFLDVRQQDMVYAADSSNRPDSGPD